MEFNYEDIYLKYCISATIRFTFNRHVYIFESKKFTKKLNLLFIEMRKFFFVKKENLPLKLFSLKVTFTHASYFLFSHIIVFISINLSESYFQWSELNTEQPTSKNI